MATSPSDVTKSAFKTGSTVLGVLLAGAIFFTLTWAISKGWKAGQS